MSATKNDQFFEKIKQYTVDELTLIENQGVVGVSNDAADPNSQKGAFGSLLLPHEWLQLDNAYIGAPPALPHNEYKSILEVNTYF